MPLPLFITKVYEGPDAERRLGELGLSGVALEEVVLKGEYARAEHTQHDPINAGGLDAYRYRVRGFRDVYCNLGWTIHRDRGLELTRSPCGTMSVLTRAGDEGVGFRDSFPQPRSLVGETTRDVVEAATLQLDPNWLNVPKVVPGLASPSIWMLLVARDGDLVRSELSLPSGFDADGLVDAWIERILLPSINMADPTANDSMPVDEIDVPIVRIR